MFHCADSPPRCDWHSGGKRACQRSPRALWTSDCARDRLSRSAISPHSAQTNGHRPPSCRHIALRVRSIHMRGFMAGAPEPLVGGQSTLEQGRRMAAGHLRQRSAVAEHPRQVGLAREADVAVRARVESNRSVKTRRGQRADRARDELLAAARSSRAARRSPLAQRLISRVICSGYAAADDHTTARRRRPFRHRAGPTTRTAALRHVAAHLVGGRHVTQLLPFPHMAKRCLRDRGQPTCEPTRPARDDLCDPPPEVLPVPTNPQLRGNYPQLMGK